MNHSVKINRALCTVQQAGYHTGQATWAAVIADIKPTLFDKLSSAELADVVMSVMTAHRGGRAHESRAILAEGAIWDGAKLREISS